MKNETQEEKIARVLMFLGYERKNNDGDWFECASNNISMKHARDLINVFNALGE